MGLCHLPPRDWDHSRRDRPRGRCRFRELTDEILVLLRALFGAIVVAGIAVGGLSYAYWDQTVLIASMAINYVRYWSAPAGTLETEVAQTGAVGQPSASTAPASPQAAPGGTEGDWPSYNKTLTSNRFSQLSQINRTNADKLTALTIPGNIPASIPGCWR